MVYTQEYVLLVNMEFHKSDLSSDNSEDIFEYEAWFAYVGIFLVCKITRIAIFDFGDCGGKKYGWKIK